jgi:hypothetical protein
VLFYVLLIFVKTISFEVNMAKRRNLKKEKALRNQAYARKFRKRTNNSRFNNRRRFGSSNRAEENEAEGGGATDGMSAEAEAAVEAV